MAFKTKFDGSTAKNVSLGTEGNPGSIEGYFIGSKATESDYGPGKLHVFQTSEGYTGVWGKTRLNSLLTDDLVGKMLRVTFTGMIAATKKGRRPSYGFKVEFDDTNTIDVAGVDLNAKAEDTSDSEEKNWSSASDVIDEEDTDTAPLPRAAAPKIPASVPSADRQARVQELLNKTRSKQA